MALKTKIKLQVRHDYKQIDVASMTGTGITGYGANQDPVGYREAASSGSDIIASRIIVTSPSGVVTKILKDSSNAYAIASNYSEFISAGTILNTSLGYSIDDHLEDGLWKVEYIEFFPNDNAVTISYSTASKTLTNVTSALLPFKNANYIYLASSMTSITESLLHTITTPVTASSPNIITDKFPTTSPVGPQFGYRVGYSSTKYIPVAKAIKECLDNKVADLVECECDEVDAELVNKYLLYDAMFINCELDNINKAQQIFDLLSKYCDDNCGCD